MAAHNVEAIPIPGVKKEPPKPIVAEITEESQPNSATKRGKGI